MRTQKEVVKIIEETEPKISSNDDFSALYLSILFLFSGFLSIIYSAFSYNFTAFIIGFVFCLISLPFWYYYLKSLDKVIIGRIYVE